MLRLFAYNLTKGGFLSGQDKGAHSFPFSEAYSGQKDNTKFAVD